MRIEIPRIYLLNLLEKASTVSGSSSISPFLRSFLLEVSADGKVFQVLRTDRELGAVAHTEGFSLLSDEGPHRVLVPSDMFINLIRSLESESVIITVNDEFSVHIEADSYKAHWMAFNSSQFPDLPRCVNTEKMFKLKSDEFVKSIERVKFAAGVDSVQANFKQIFFEDDTCWAWDGFTYQSIAFPTPEPFSLPLEAIDVVKFIRLSGVEDVFVEVSPEHLYFVVGMDIFVAKNSNVEPPSKSEISKLLTKSPGFFVVEVAQLRKLIRRIGITSDHSRILVDVRDNSLTISSKDEYNKSDESVLIAFEGEAKKLNRFSLNWEFLDKALQSVNSKTVKISVETKHIILEGDDSYGVLSMLSVN